MPEDTSTSNKLVVLFVMEKFEMPLTEDALLSICCTENDWLRYLYCKQVLGELIKSGFITRTTLPGNNASLLSITADGRACIPVKGAEEIGRCAPMEQSGGITAGHRLFC